jgi:hypothetical protein
MPGFSLGGGADTAPSFKAEYRRKHRWLFSSSDVLGAKEFAYLKSAQRPNIKIEEVKVSHDQEKSYLAGQHTFEPIEIEFNDAMNPTDISKKIYDWLIGGKGVFSSFGTGDAVTVNSPEAYKINMELELIDGQGQTVEAWKLYNCWTASVDWGDLNHEQNEVTTVKVQLRFDRALKTI